MNLSEIEQEVLWACGDDYEAPHTICSAVARAVDRAVSESEIRATFLSLAEKGLVQAYVFDGRLKKWNRIAASAAAQQRSSWFKVTSRGAQVVDEDAD
jgi:hypothetical protein